MKPEQQAKTLDLIHHLLEGQLTDSQQRELNDLLRTSPDARDLYIQLTSIHVGLERTLGSGFTTVPPSLMSEQALVHLPTRNNSKRGVYRVFKRIAIACAASFIAAAAMTLGIFYLSNRSTVETAMLSRDMATLILAEDCKWENHQAIHEGDRLNKQVLSLIEGTALIRFDGGTEMLFSSPTEIEILSAESARLLMGKVNVRGTEGFKLSTASCDLIDLGTEFVASVSDFGRTQLHVLRGQVAITKRTGEQADQIVEEGGLAQISDIGDSALPMPQMGPGFQQLLDQALTKQPATPLQTQESFTYPEGSFRPVELSGGNGWASPWRMRSRNEFAPLHELKNPRLVDSHEMLDILSGDLIPTEDPESSAGRLSLPPGRHYRLRNLNVPIEMGVEGITYFSMQFRQTGLPTRDQTQVGEPTLSEDSFRITFRSRDDYWNEKLLFGLRSNEFPMVHTFGSGLFDSMASVSTESPVLWTGKIIRHKSKEDEIYFRIFTKPEDIEAVEPSTWHIATRGVYMSQSFDTLVLTSIGRANIEVDEIRIGSSWRSVARWYHPSKQ